MIHSTTINASPEELNPNLTGLSRSSLVAWVATTWLLSWQLGSKTQFVGSLSAQPLETMTLYALREVIGRVLHLVGLHRTGISFVPSLILRLCSEALRPSWLTLGSLSWESDKDAVGWWCVYIYVCFDVRIVGPLQEEPGCVWCERVWELYHISRWLRFLGTCSVSFQLSSGFRWTLDNHVTKISGGLVGGSPMIFVSLCKWIFL